MDKSEKFVLMLEKAIEQHPKEFKGFDKTKNVQDQLQEMIIRDFDDVQDMFYTFNCWMYERPWKTAEQLWLAFLMKLEYCKTWDGKEWVNGN